DPATEKSKSASEETPGSSGRPLDAPKATTEPLFPTDVSPLRMLHDLRQSRHLPGHAHPINQVINAVGYRLVALVTSGQEELAELMLRRVAEDIPTWSTDGLLEGLAEGLSTRVEGRLAALAYAYAYTRSRDGWRRFGGQEHEGLFRRALALDAAAAWEVLASEIAGSVANGGELGVTTHSIELLVAGDLTDQAFSAWDAARTIVENRLLPAAPADDVRVAYDSGGARPEEAVAASALARINHVCSRRRHLAVALSTLLLRRNPMAFARGARIVLKAG